jgi:hypothetical protein
MVACQCVIFASSLSNVTDLQFPAVLKIMEIDPINFLRIAERFAHALRASPVSSSAVRYNDIQDAIWAV